MPRMTFVGLCGQIPSRIRKCHYQVPPPRTICAYLRRRRLGPTLVSSCVRARAASDSRRDDAPGSKGEGEREARATDQRLVDGAMYP